ncbi:hypothetical protein B0A48_12742 [Cryoendolithus antarcticus]|uniref:Uncharacterized protein n=1 Tax=Cryoendolithus antarcticus TaxID=1507870 RepID=A0A1V8SRA3_9PEZI|nr:hypothetical protein B0A48_12742 [Cryoendolithus antarcticus]
MKLSIALPVAALLTVTVQAAGPEQGVNLKREDDCEKNSTIAGSTTPAPPYGGYGGYSPPPYGGPTGWHATGGIPVTSTVYFLDWRKSSDGIELNFIVQQLHEHLTLHNFQ